MDDQWQAGVFRKAALAALHPDAGWRVAGEKELLRWHAAANTGIQRALAVLCQLVSSSSDGSSVEATHCPEVVRLHAALALREAVVPQEEHTFELLLNSISEAAVVAGIPRGPLQRLLAQTWARLLVRAWRQPSSGQIRQQRVWESWNCKIACVSRNVQDSASVTALSFLAAGADEFALEHCTVARRDFDDHLLPPFSRALQDLFEAGDGPSTEALSAGAVLFGCRDESCFRNTQSLVFPRAFGVNAQQTALQLLRVLSAAFPQLLCNEARNAALRMLAGISVVAVSSTEVSGEGSRLLATLLSVVVELINRLKHSDVNNLAGAATLADLCAIAAVSIKSFGFLSAVKILGPTGISVFADVPILLCSFRGALAEESRLHEALEHCLDLWASLASQVSALTSSQSGAQTPVNADVLTVALELVHRQGGRVFEAFACNYPASRAGASDDDLEEPCECGDDEGWGGARMVECARRAASIGRAFGATQAVDALRGGLERAAAFLAVDPTKSVDVPDIAWDELCLLTMLSMNVGFVEHDNNEGQSLGAPGACGDPLSRPACAILPLWARCSIVSRALPFPQIDEGAIVRLGCTALELCRRLIAFGDRASPVALTCTIELIARLLSVAYAHSNRLVELRHRLQPLALELLCVLRCRSGERPLERACFIALIVALSPHGGSVEWESHQVRSLVAAICELSTPKLSEAQLLSDTALEGLTIVTAFVAARASPPRLHDLLVIVLPRAEKVFIGGELVGPKVISFGRSLRLLRGLVRALAGMSDGVHSAATDAARVGWSQDLLPWLTQSLDGTSRLAAALAPTINKSADRLPWVPLRREALRLALSVADAVASLPSSIDVAGKDEVVRVVTKAALGATEAAAADVTVLRGKDEACHLALDCASEGLDLALQMVNACQSENRLARTELVLRPFRGGVASLLGPLLLGRPKLQLTVFGLLEKSFGEGGVSAAASMIASTPAFAEDVITLLSSAVGTGSRLLCAQARELAANAVVHLGLAAASGSTPASVDVWLSRWLWAQLADDAANTLHMSMDSVGSPSTSASVASAMRPLQVVLQRFVASNSCGSIVNKSAVTAALLADGSGAPAAARADPAVCASFHRLLEVVARSGGQFVGAPQSEAGFQDAVSDLRAHLRLAAVTT